MNCTMEPAEILKRVKGILEADHLTALELGRAPGWNARTLAQQAHYRGKAEALGGIIDLIKSLEEGALLRRPSPKAEIPVLRQEMTLLSVLIEQLEERLPDVDKGQEDIEVCRISSCPGCGNKGLEFQSFRNEAGRLERQAWCPKCQEGSEL